MPPQPAPAARRRPLLPLLALAACGPGAPGAASPEPLAYDLPAPNPVAYTFLDSAAYAVDTGELGVLRTESVREGRAVLTFAPGVADGAAGLEVEVAFPRLEATFTTATGVERADASSLGGVVRVVLGVRGDLRDVAAPAMEPTLDAVVGAESLVRPLFVRLPGRPIETGAVWVDTVEVRESVGETTTVGRHVVTSTLAGDTVVGGRTLLRILTRTDNALEQTGRSGGVDVRQRLSGETLGTLLWDRAASLLVERLEEGTLIGTLEMPGATARVLPVEGSVRRAVRLDPATEPDG